MDNGAVFLFLFLSPLRRAPPRRRGWAFRWRRLRLVGV